MISIKPIHLPHRIVVRSRGFTLIEIMIVVGILGIVLAIAAPTWVRQRLISQQRVCQENLTKIDGAKEQWALEKNEGVDAEPAWGDLVQDDGSGYINKIPVCPSGGEYVIGSISSSTTCSVTDPLDHNEKP